MIIYTVFDGMSFILMEIMLQCKHTLDAVSGSILTFLRYSFELA